MVGPAAGEFVGNLGPLPFCVSLGIKIEAHHLKLRQLAAQRAQHSPNGRRHQIDGVAAEPRYVDVSVPPGVRKRIAVEPYRNAFAYVFAGSGTFRDASPPRGVLTDHVAESGESAAGR